MTALKVAAFLSIIAALDWWFTLHHPDGRALASRRRRKARNRAIRNQCARVDSASQLDRLDRHHH